MDTCFYKIFFLFQICKRPRTWTQSGKYPKINRGKKRKRTDRDDFFSPRAKWGIEAFSHRQVAHMYGEHWGYIFSCSHSSYKRTKGLYISHYVCSWLHFYCSFSFNPLPWVSSWVVTLWFSSTELKSVGYINIYTHLYFLYYIKAQELFFHFLSNLTSRKKYILFWELLQLSRCWAFISISVTFIIGAG